MILAKSRAGLGALAVCLSCAPFAAHAASAQDLPTLTRGDYDAWEALGPIEIDPTGRWIVATVRTIGGDSEVRVHSSDGSTTPRILARGSRATFTPDGTRLVWLQQADDDAEEGSPEAESRLGIVDLEEGSDSLLFATRTFELSPDGRWVAAMGAPASDTVGADVTVLELATGRRTTLGNVADVAWRDTGALLALTLRTASGIGNGVSLFDPEAGSLLSLDASAAEYRGLVWRDDADDLAVMRSVSLDGRDDDGHDLMLWTDVSGALVTRSPRSRLLEAVGRTDLPDSLRVVESGGISWSEDGRAVFVGLRLWPGEPLDDEGGEAEGTDDVAEGEFPSDSTAADDDEIEPSPVQVWHWNDDRILRAQEYFETADARRTLLAAWHVDEDRLVRLGEEFDEPVRLSGDGRWGVVEDLDPYAFERRFGASIRDLYRVDIDTGERSLIAEGTSTGAILSPTGARALVYDGSRWSMFELTSLDELVLGPDADVTFTQPLDVYDYPGVRPPFGVGGWASDASAVWLYDEHDVWEADLSSGALRRRTPGAEDGLQYRVVNLDPDASPFNPSAAGVDTDDGLWLRIFDPETKASGYGRARGNDAEVERLVLEDASIGRLARADDADVFVLTRETFEDSPDVFVGGRDLSDLRQVGRTNPQQADFAWGRNQLLSYTTDAGHDLHAILTYPADYDPSRTYPLILYQYERLSQGLHRYVAPSQTGYYNVQVWSQAGYFVLQPDILYEPGRPGPSAVDAIEHALDAALAAAPVDADRMGLIGHSWGGYQAAYVPTRMHRFAASVAGAAITNFLSFPGTVHWNGGLPELGHWETGQARMARPPWDDMPGHIESSPVAAIHELETPMLLMHGDADGVVDFRQGLEFYNYARRLGKEVVMLVYPGADHGLRREENQVDYQTRILEWFDHYLKGGPAASWITEGEDWDARSKRIGG